MLQELHIQSNLPIIILTVLVICAIVLGYLEFKKVNNMIDLINNRLDGLKNIKPEAKQGKPQVSDDLSKIPLESPQESTKNNDMKNTNEKQIEKMPPKNFDPLSAVMGGLPFGGFMLQTGGPMMPMGFEAKDMKDITEIGLDEDMNDEEKDEIDVMEVEDIDVEKEIYGLENDDNDDNISESSQSYSDDSDDSDENDSDDEVIELISGEGKVEEIDVEKDNSENSEEEQSEEEQSEEEEDKVVIDDSLSVKQLKTICEEMNISQSGNKSQLIKRIIDNKK